MPAGDGLPPSHYNIWMSALCQSMTTLVADFVSLAIDWKYHSLDYFTHWVTDMRKFLVYILVIVTLGASRSVTHANASHFQWRPVFVAHFQLLLSSHNQAVCGAAHAVLPHRNKRARHTTVLL